MKILGNVLVKVKDKDIIDDDVFIIPEGIEIIGTRCFKENKKIKIVKCPSTLKIIGEAAFNDSSIEMIELNKGLLEIRNLAFKNSKLKIINLPNTLKFLGEESFAECYGLQELKLSNQVKNIPRSCFRCCYQLYFIKLENGVEKINDFAFATCIGLRRVECCPSLKEIGEGIFQQSGRVEEIYLNEGLTTIKKHAFVAFFINKIYFPASLTYIGDEAFQLNKIEKMIFANVDVFKLFMEKNLEKIIEKKEKIKRIYITINSLVEKNSNYGNFYYDYSEFFDQKIASTNLITIDSSKKFDRLISKLKKIEVKKNKVIQLNKKILLSTKSKLNIIKKLDKNLIEDTNQYSTSYEVGEQNMSYEIDENGRMWLNGDLLTPKAQQEIEKKVKTLKK